MQMQTYITKLEPVVGVSQDSQATRKQKSGEYAKKKVAQKNSEKH
jgi:hypothetical protein